MTPGAQIDRLRERGWRINVTHRRPITVGHSSFGLLTRAELAQHSDPRARFAQHGGETEVVVWPPAATLFGIPLGFTGMSYCRGDDPDTGEGGEQFNKRLGLTIALGRALKSARLFDPELLDA